jgi:4-hydroxybenzoate polyprenyltransferase
MNVDLQQSPRPTIVSCLPHYVAMARPDHWIKNIFVLPGAAVGLLLTHRGLDAAMSITIVGALIATCLAASANYTVNEYLDAAYDRFHPSKQHRPAVLGLVGPRLTSVQYVVLASASLWIAWMIATSLCIVAAILLIMGIAYNVPPLRTKDRAYLDVLSESVNNPLRFLIGWFAIDSTQFPPSSILLSYWMGGAFLMAVKRYSEYRRIGNPIQAGLYRRSFARYTEATLHLSALFYAVTSSFFLGVFLIKYRVEFLLTFPFFALLFTWYMAIGLRPESAAQAPEKLYREGRFLSFVAFLVILVCVLFFVDLPFMRFLMAPVAFHLSP